MLCRLRFFSLGSCVWRGFNSKSGFCRVLCEEIFNCNGYTLLLVNYQKLLLSQIGKPITCLM